MAKVIVYNVNVFDIIKGGSVLSKRMATEEGAKIMKGAIIPESAIEISLDELENGEQWTPIGYNPSSDAA